MGGSPGWECDEDDDEENPPAPAFTKAGAAPGTTAGVEPVPFPGLQTPHRPRQLRPGTQAIAIWVCRSHLLLLRRSTCRLPAFKALKCSAAASTRHAGHSHCYYRRSKLPFARPQMPKTVSKTLRDSFDRQLRPAASTRHSGHSHLLLSASIGVRGCRLPALKGLKPAAAASTRHSGHSHLLLPAFEAAVCPPSKA